MTQPCTSPNLLQQRRAASSEADGVFKKASITPIRGVAAAPCEAEQQLSGCREDGADRRETESAMTTSGWWFIIQVGCSHGLINRYKTELWKTFGFVCLMQSWGRASLFSLYYAGEMETFQIKQKAVLLGVLCRKHSVYLSRFQHLEGLVDYFFTESFLFKCIQN